MGSPSLIGLEKIPPLRTELIKWANHAIEERSGEVKSEPLNEIRVPLGSGEMEKICSIDGGCETTLKFVLSASRLVHLCYLNLTEISTGPFGSRSE